MRTVFLVGIFLSSYLTSYSQSKQHISKYDLSVSEHEMVFLDSMIKLIQHGEPIKVADYEQVKDIEQRIERDNAWMEKRTVEMKEEILRLNQIKREKEQRLEQEKLRWKKQEKAMLNHLEKVKRRNARMEKKVEKKRRKLIRKGILGEPQPKVGIIA